jgi:hypothetical protein
MLIMFGICGCILDGVCWTLENGRCIVMNDFTYISGYYSIAGILNACMITKPNLDT